MYKTLFLLAITTHVLGDFYLQTKAMAENKKQKYSAVFRHCLLYAIPLVVLAVYWSVQALVLAIVLWALHYIIDSFKFFWMKHNPATPEPVTYGLDQTLHVLLILITIYCVKLLGYPFALPSAVDSLPMPLPGGSSTVVQWLLLFLLIGKPANISIKVMTLKYKPQDDDAPSAKKNAGAFIGTLERLLIALLLCVSQYAAIGLVLTAKSVARYEKLKDKVFAEYYLLGTLLSTLLVIAAYLMIFVVLSQTP